ncbi:PadR family transcriptional regulator [Microbacterium sp. ARD31]|uniref:PadR family transcriptional regulator n=1 Tax=Microbacterium sp. ARD31 TaxID=2962576 RepID=UPI002882D3AE|nr:PadR family transcriptional regulator [Microbacterium sp. ARD31]MDT0184975.1 PadR family transcriptional regulator [Microbacterium sp. ARD31]
MALRFAILGALAHKPSSGYDLVKQFDQTFNYVWWASHGAVYTELQKLERDGLVEPGESGSRGRIQYRVTDTGVRALQDWLRAPAARKPRDEMVLRVFQLWLLDPEEAADYLDGLADAHAERLAEYERREAVAELDPDRPAAFYNLLALRAGIATEKAVGAWARESAAEVRRLGPRAVLPDSGGGS